MKTTLHYKNKCSYLGLNQQHFDQPGYNCKSRSAPILNTATFCYGNFKFSLTINPI
jgi:hypothetical protein